MHVYIYGPRRIILLQCTVWENHYTLCILSLPVDKACHLAVMLKAIAVSVLLVGILHSTFASVRGEHSTYYTTGSKASLQCILAMVTCKLSPQIRGRQRVRSVSIWHVQNLPAPILSRQCVGLPAILAKLNIFWRLNTLLIKEWR